MRLGGFLRLFSPQNIMLEVGKFLENIIDSMSMMVITIELMKDVFNFYENF